METDERQCIKCGRPVAADQSICEVCNRAGMRTPSASQYHGTIVVAIVLAVVGLAIAGSLSLRGIGPFRGTALAFAGAPQGGVQVTVEVTNDGTRAGRATCQLLARDGSGRRVGGSTAVTPSIADGGRIVFSERIPGVDPLPADVSVDCR